MKYKRLANTDIDVSLIAVGTMTYGEQNSESEAHEQLDYSIAQGVNFIDTAEMMQYRQKRTQGKTRKLLASWLAKEITDKILSCNSKLLALEWNICVEAQD